MAAGLFSAVKGALSSGSTAASTSAAASSAASTASTTAAAGSSLSTAAEYASVASSAIGTAAAVSGGQYAQEAGHYQAEVLKEEAKNEAAAAGAKISTQDIEASRELSTVAARAGGSGITATSAEPILSEDYTQAKMRDAYTRYSGKLASSQDLYAATLAAEKGSQLNAAGVAGGVQSLLAAPGNVYEIELGG